MTRNERDAHAALDQCNDCRCSSYAIGRAGGCPNRGEPQRVEIDSEPTEPRHDPRPARWLAVSFVAVVWCAVIVWALS